MLPIIATLAGIAVGDEITEAVFGGSISPSQNIDWENARMLLESEISELERTRRSEADSSGSVVAVSSWAEIRQQVGELRARLRQNLYSFDVFEVDSFNYGLMVTHRQTWVPGEYQAGRLVASLPLAPGEKREVSFTQKVKESTESKNRSKFSFTESMERSTTTRAEDEILQKAQTKTGFEQTVDGEFTLVEGMTIGGNTKIGVDAASETARTQKSFREAVLKAASSYTREREVEVTTSVERSSEQTQSASISNPNNEITVTYLFYELQRQYTISEKIRTITPYVFVARDVPAPHDVDVDFLIAHAWIFRKALLEPGLGEVLDYLEEDYAGDAVQLDYLRDRWEVHRDLVRRLAFQVEALRRSQQTVADEITGTILRKGEKEGMFEDVAEFLFGGTDEKSERQAEQEAAERSMEYVATDLQDLTARLVAATDAFSQATAELAEAAAEHSNWKIRIDQARIHVKDNILWYMHAIWDHEVPDQRFFAFYNKKVLVPTAPDTAARFQAAGSGALRNLSPAVVSFQRTQSPFKGLRFRAGLPHLDLEAVLPPPELNVDADDGHEWRQLVDVADLNEPIYVGNMVGFPLKEHNYLTFWMASEYLDDELGVSDPDPLAEIDLEAAMDNINCADLSEADKTELIGLLVDKLQAPSTESDLIVIPTGQLFVEALPGSHPVLEHFKREHRKIDVERAAYAAAGEEVETLRRASRILTGDFSQPEIDRVVRVEGGPTPQIVINADDPEPSDEE